MGRHRLSNRRFQERNGLETLKELHFLIRQLDSICAFRRAGTAALEASFQRVNLTNTWEKIKPDVETITFFPDTIPEILKLVKSVAFLRALFPICFFSFILSVLMMIGIIPVSNKFVLLFFLFLPILVMIAFVLIDFTIRRKIIKVEKEQPNLHSEEKRRIKKIVEELITKLSKRIKKQGENPSNYKMRLFYDDYKGIEILKRKRESVYGIFKKKYFTYIAVPSLKR
jgi:hypothetical protein